MITCLNNREQIHLKWTEGSIFSLSIPLSADVSALGDAVGVAVPRAEVDAVVEAAARAVLSVGELLLGVLVE